nr:retrovirus-related Pol polyprotein from transposon TNT 1-94 [Tanacetum cinerariifolium]
VITKKDVNSDFNGLSSTGVDNTKTRRPQPRSNTKNDRNQKAKVFVKEIQKKYQPNVTKPKKNQKAKVFVKEIQKKYQPKVTKTKKVEHQKSLATPKPRKPRFLLRWSPTGRLFDLEGKLAAFSFSSISSGSFWERSAFGNDHVAAIMGFSDLQWRNILITRVYFVEGLGHNMFSVGQFCNSDLENGVVERRNRTLVEAARTMLIFSRALLFLWVEVIATACFTQNCSIIHRHFNKTPYELINGRKLDISFLHVFEALYYPKNDCEDIRKLGEKGDIGFFIGYSTDSCTYRVYN